MTATRDHHRTRSRRMGRPARPATTAGHDQALPHRAAAAIRLRGPRRRTTTRDPSVKLPKRAREEPNPPPAKHLAAILDAMGERTGCSSSRSARWAAGGRSRKPALGRRRLRRITAAATALRPSGTRRGGSPCPSGSCRQSTPPARSKTGRPSARSSRARRRARLPGDGAGLQAGRDAALPPARPAPPSHHDLAPARRTAREVAHRAGHARPSNRWTPTATSCRSMT